MAKKFNVFLDVTIKVNTSYEVNAKDAESAKEIAQAAAIARLRAEPVTQLTCPKSSLTESSASGSSARQKV